MLEKWTLDLITMKCPICHPYVPFSKVNEKNYMKLSTIVYNSVESLNLHMREAHHKALCPVCVESNTMFIFEYTPLSDAVLLTI